MTLSLIIKSNVLSYDSVNEFFDAVKYYRYEQVRVGDVVYSITDPKLRELARKHEESYFCATGIDRF